MINIQRHLRVIIFFMSLVPIPAFADGKDLLAQCVAAERFMESDSKDDALKVGLCIGLVQGVNNTMQIMNSGSKVKVCFPKGGITNAQAIDIVLTYLRTNPSKLHQNEVLLAMSAFGSKFPCI